MTQPQTSAAGPGLQASDLISKVLRSVAPFTSIRRRNGEFKRAWQAELMAVGSEIPARRAADRIMSDYWENQELDTSEPVGEVVIGSGYHAAVYCATRVLAGYPRPLVLERDDRVGGTFAMTVGPGFYLNSSNRPGPSGVSQRLGRNLNDLPGAPVQVHQLSRDEYQTNDDMAFVIRATLAQYANVVSGETVSSVGTISGEGVFLTLADGRTLRAARIIDARGLGDPVETPPYVQSPRVFTFPRFMQQMDSALWPLEGMRRVVVAGDGDSAKCAVEALLGLGPRREVTDGIDRVERVDWYAEGLPTSFPGWVDDVRGRYIRLGRQVRSGEYGSTVNIVNARMPFPVAAPDGVFVNGRQYDMAIMCTGNRRKPLTGVRDSEFGLYRAPGSDSPIAEYCYDRPIFRIGPAAGVGFSSTDLLNGITGIENNAVSMFRTGRMTATLATMLPGVVLPVYVDDDEEYDL